MGLRPEGDRRRSVLRAHGIRGPGEACLTRHCEECGGPRARPGETISRPRGKCTACATTQSSNQANQIQHRVYREEVEATEFAERQVMALHASICSSCTKRHSLLLRELCGLNFFSVNSMLNLTCLFPTLAAHQQPPARLKPTAPHQTGAIARWRRSCPAALRASAVSARQNAATATRAIKLA
jgi:hypothetical protein